MGKTIDFIKDGIVEHRIYLNDETEYICIDNTMVGEHTIKGCDGECRIVHQNRFDITLENSETEEELVAGRFIIIAQPDVEIPDWETINTEYYSKS